MRAWVLVGLVGFGGSAVLIVAGLAIRDKRSFAAAVISLGILGIFVSAGWLALGYYVDTVTE